MRNTKLTLIVLLILTLTGCSIREYYFPMNHLTEGKVYKYESKLDPIKTQYWKLIYDTETQTLTTEAYENDFRQYELFKEKVTDKGTEIIQFTSFIEKNDGSPLSVDHTPKDVDVFRWDKMESYKYSTEADYNGDFQTIFTKEREYAGETTINILGEDHEAVKLKGEYKTIVLESAQKFEYTQYSYYIKGIGLAKMEKEFSDGKKEVLELTEIMSLDEWNKRQ